MNRAKPALYVGAYAFVVVQLVERTLNKQQCPACGHDADRSDVSGKCPFCDVRWEWVPSGEIAVTKPTLGDLLPGCTTLVQAYPENADPGAIYLVAAQEGSDATATGRDRLWLTSEEIDHKIGLFKKVFDDELRQINAHPAVWTWFVPFGVFTSKEL